MAKVSHVEIYVSDYAKSIRFYDRFYHTLVGKGWSAKGVIRLSPMA